MSKKIGRNDPCPCGSGKKYKHCCLGSSKAVTGNLTTGSKTTGSKTTGNKTTGSKTTGSKTTGSKTTGSKTTGSKTTGSKTTGSKTTGSKTTGNLTAGSKTTGNKTTQNQTASKSEKRIISPLAIMRFEQRLQEKPEQLEQIGKQIEQYYDRKDISFKDFILKSWNLDKVKKMSTSEIIETLRSINVDFEIERFKEQAQSYVSAIQLAEDHYYTQNFQAEGKDEDFIWLAMIELWNRIIPEKYNMEMIDDLIQDGYDDIENQNYRDGMEKWEKAWNIIVSIVPPHIKSVTDADKFISVLTQSIFNWCQDFEMELANAALEDAFFHLKRTKYCQDFRRIFPYSDKLIIKNMLKAEAESRAALGDTETAKK
ncbi:SEC-C metal-binding domain-containing protein [Methanosarcina spelaei]|nr:SEC-C metal-binding domain-containing protein [Methanosarcina spelaei]